MKFQSLPSIFVYVLVFISINALFVLNEQSGFLMDSEFKLIIGEQFGENPILVDVSQYLFSLLGGQAFLWRLFPMAAIVISLLFSYRLGKNLFGKDSLQWAMIIVTCSIFMLFYGRLFSLDKFYFTTSLSSTFDWFCKN
jgi:4-amino-4-deoxy-L-arabinose transferase-like glycosyltransferase